jgi:hypothetical protein
MWLKNHVYERNVTKWDALLARILDAAVRIKEHRDQVRQKTSYTHKRAAKCIEVEGRILENLL